MSSKKSPPPSSAPPLSLPLRAARRDDNNKDKDKDKDDGIDDMEQSITTAETCEAIRMAVHNMERTLRCPMCLSCFRSATMLSTCCHVYCLQCLKQAQQASGSAGGNKCPVCQQRCTHRSRVPAPAMNDLVRAFKETARAFGLLPSVPDANLALTQLPAESSSNNSNNTSSSSSQQQQQAASLSNSLTDVHDRLLAARTFRKYNNTTSGAVGAKIWADEQALLVANHEQALLQASVRRGSSIKQKMTTTAAAANNNNTAAAETAAAAVSFTNHHTPPPRTGTKPNRTADHNPATTTTTAMEQTKEDRKPAASCCPVVTPAWTAVRSSSHSSNDDKPPTAANKNNGKATSDNDGATPTPTIATFKSPSAPMGRLTNTAALAKGATNQDDEEEEEEEVFYSALDEPPASMTMDLSSQYLNADSHQEGATRVDDNDDDDAPATNDQDEDKVMEEAPAEKATMETSTAKASKAALDNSEHASSPASAESGMNSLAETTTDVARDTNAVASPATSSSSGRQHFGVGDLIQVQARTWPGVNLHGGVGRVTAVHEDRESNHFRYDVRYVLGGRERFVDAVFCSSTDLPKMGRRRGPPADQQADFTASRRLAQKMEGGTLPPVLLAQLKSEGFDVDGKVEPSAVAAAFAKKSAKKENESPAAKSNNRKSKPVKDSVTKEPTKKETETATNKNRKRKSAENDAQLQTKPQSKKRRLGESILSRVTSALTSKKKMQIAPTPVALSDEEACSMADQKYRERFEKALKKGTLSLATSSLSDDETKLVEILCRQQKKIRLKMSNSITKQTTLCIIPADPKEPQTAKFRTAKAMRAALLGIPIVTPAWVEDCLSKGSPVAPTTYLRALPTKSSDKKTTASCGIAQLASRATGLLHNCQVYVCLPSRLQQDVVQFLKDAGANLTSSVASPANSQPLLLMCGDTDHNVSKPVIMAVNKNPEQYLVAHTRWLFDSISCGAPISDLSSYAPPGSKAQSLWKLCQKG